MEAGTRLPSRRVGVGRRPVTRHDSGCPGGSGSGAPSLQSQRSNASLAGGRAVPCHGLGDSARPPPPEPKGTPVGSHFAAGSREEKYQSAWRQSVGPKGKLPATCTATDRRGRAGAGSWHSGTDAGSARRGGAAGTEPGQRPGASAAGACDYPSREERKEARGARRGWGRRRASRAAEPDVPRRQRARREPRTPKAPAARLPSPAGGASARPGLAVGPALLGPTGDPAVSGPARSAGTAQAQPTGPSGPLPPRVPRGLGRGGARRGPDAFQAEGEAISATLCSSALGKAGAQPRRGAPQLWTQGPPIPEHPALVSPGHLGTPDLRPGCWPRLRTAGLGPRRGAAALQSVGRHLSHLGVPRALSGRGA